ncbi:Multi-sensor hybrid histidine kinase (fragment) [Candidatus Terasakiella magnetica]|uniref:histidine kinase n=1 Tax=Candidatus Terasakiella magnetica TaxID=1867952 RepID=A0A1C3RCF8_9PROT
MAARKNKNINLSSVFDFSEAALYLDKDAKILDVNPLANKLFGYSKGHLKGKSAKLLIPESYAELKSLLSIQNIADSKRVKRFNKRAINSQTKNSNKLKLGVNLSFINYPDERNRIAVLLCLDITSRFNERERRLQAEEMLHEAIETIPDGFVIYDQDDKLLTCNSAYLDIYKTSAEAMKKGVTFEKIIRYGIERGQYPQAGQTKEEQEEWLVERLRRHRNPDKVVIQQTDEGRWLKIDERKTKHDLIVGIRTDITDLKNAEYNLIEQRKLLEEQAVELQNLAQEYLEEKERAEAASKAKSEFSAIISHELRTPLTGIMGITDLLLSSELPAQHRKYIEGLKSSSNNLLLLLNDILDYSKFEAEQVSLEPVVFDFEQLLKNIVTTLKPAADEKLLKILKEVRSDISPLVIKADKTRLRQVILNYATNAIKFTHFGAVVIRVMLNDETAETLKLRIEVDDTGIGIPEEYKSKLFKPFSQGDSSTTRKYGGTGLGLAICKQLIDTMGGDIGFESEAGVGSTFWFECNFPKAQQAELSGLDTKLNSLGALDHGQPAHPLKLLLAEDNPINSKIIMTVLKKMGYEVDLAQNGLEAFEKAKADSFDLILMDMQMPKMDGCQATEEIRKLDGAVANIPIIALTADVKAEKNERYQKAGINAFLSKPVDWLLLEETIKKLKQVPET